MVTVARLPGYLDMDLQYGPPPLAKTTLAMPRGGTYCISATMLQQLGFDGPPGPWNREHENSYQKDRQRIDQILQMFRDSPSEAAKQVRGDPQYWEGLSKEYLYLRFGRLCEYLRQRKPDDSAGHSILIYRLSDDQVRQALLGDPAELCSAK